MLKRKTVPKYKHLKGVQFTIFSKVYQNGVEVFVAQIDYKIGITIKYLDFDKSLGNKEGNFYCLDMKKKYVNETLNNHQEFLHMIKVIKKGNYDCSFCSGSEGLSCAF